MRARDFLLEFNVKITTDRLGRRILERAGLDRTAARFFGSLRGEHGIARAMRDGMWEKSPDFLDDRRIQEIAVAAIAEFDPSRNKDYAQWMCLRYADEGIPLWEDFGKARAYLTMLEALKKSGYFKRNPDDLQKADIGRYKTLSELGEFIISKGDADTVSNNAADRAKEAQLVEDGGAIILVNTNRFKVVSLRSQDAASFYGRNTQWCTTMDNGGYFSDYIEEGPLYLILDKPNNKRWQFHYETNQFMDENDKSIVDYTGGTRSLRDFPPEFWAVIPSEMLVRHATNSVLQKIERDNPFPIPEESWKRITREDLKLLSNISNYVLEGIAMQNRTPGLSATCFSLMDMYELASTGIRLLGGSDHQDKTLVKEFLAEYAKRTPNVYRADGAVPVTFGGIYQILHDTQFHWHEQAKGFWRWLNFEVQDTMGYDDGTSFVPHSQCYFVRADHGGTHYYAYMQDYHNVAVNFVKVTGDKYEEVGKTLVDKFILKTPDLSPKWPEEVLDVLRDFIANWASHVEKIKRQYARHY